MTTMTAVEVILGKALIRANEGARPGDEGMSWSVARLQEGRFMSPSISPAKARAAAGSLVRKGLAVRLAVRAGDGSARYRLTPEGREAMRPFCPEQRWTPRSLGLAAVVSASMRIDLEHAEALVHEASAVPGGMLTVQTKTEVVSTGNSALRLGTVLDGRTWWRVGNGTLERYAVRPQTPPQEGPS
jgi:hypothetical protein